MANGNYSVLKDNIDDYIKQNGDGDITGQVLQTQLFAMITSLGAGYQFMGVAKLTPTPTDPGSPDQNVFYVAFQPGIYSNFGSQTVADGEIAILKWNGSWTKEVTGAASAAKLDELGHKVGFNCMPLGEIEPDGCFLLTNNQFYFNAAQAGYFIPCAGKSKYSISSVAGVNVVFAFVKSKATTNYEAADYATGASRQVIYGNNTNSGNVPSDAVYLYVSKASSGNNWFPSSVILDDYDYVKGAVESIAEIKEGLSDIIVDVNGGGDYTSLLAGVLAATQDMDKVVFVRKGNYDLITEFVAQYGADFFTNYTISSVKGIILKNRVKITFAAGANVVCNYTGNNSNVRAYFSPFNAGEYGFEIDGLNVSAKNVRYCVHDERNTDSDLYKNTYKNCKFYLDNSGSDQTFRSCIGGGLGRSGNIVVDGCTFESVIPAPRSIVSWHNTNASSGKSIVIVKNCYFKGDGTLQFKYHGTSTEVSQAIVCDNYFERFGPYSVGPEVAADDSVVNVEMLAFNNTISGGPDNLDEAVFKCVPLGKVVSFPFFLNTSNLFVQGNYTGWFIPCDGASEFEISTIQSVNVVYAFLKTRPGKPDDTPDFATGSARTVLFGNTGKHAGAVPSDAKYLYVSGSINGVDWMPRGVVLDGYDYVSAKGVGEGGQMWFEGANISPLAEQNNRPIVYAADTKAASNFINNAVMYPDGVIIAARSNGKIVRIALDGTETELLSVTGTDVEWRGLFMDSNLNVYASPHASLGTLTMTDRGLYKLAYGANSFTKVISLYNPASSDPYEAQQNDDTIWTMCEDAGGYLYSGVYAHTTRPSPRIYRSTDGGDTWVDFYDFTSIAPTGQHIHSIIYNPFNDALYAIVGEINTIFKSTDRAANWTNLNAAAEDGKGTAMLAVPDGIVIGSDTAYSFIMSKMYPDEKRVETKGRFWANTCFGIRRSDVTGWLYAFGKIDSSVNTTSYMPPIAALTDAGALTTWIASSPAHLADWQKYHNNVDGIYPEDSIRPTHFGIFVSKDNGESWECIYREQVTSQFADGIWCVGYFRNGECICSRVVEGEMVKPMVISEGKHKYGANGLNLDGEILIRTNTSDDVTPL